MDENVDLKVILLAKGVEVATSAEPAIWLATMSLITGQAPAKPAAVSPKAVLSANGNDAPGDASETLARFAADLQLDPQELEFAAGPSLEPPFIHLDHKYWQALRSNMPARGPQALAPVALAATLLLLWNRHAKFGEVTTRMCAQVLGTIDVQDKNPSRSVKSCDWLQLRGKSVKLNAALISRAEAVARAYCTRSAPEPSSK
jgi:hypothetical protein